MVSIFHALLGLVGLVCSAVLTFGLVSNQADEPASDPPADVAAVIESAPGISDELWNVAGDDDEREAPTVTPRAATKTVQRRVFRVTAYCARGTTASGSRAGVGQCAAPAHVPFGSRIYVPALGRTFVVTDRTHRRFRHNTVDIFIPSKSSCLRFGRSYLECHILPPGKKA